jgi:hypothetical protein
MNEIARQTGGTQVDDPGRRPLRVPSGATDDRILAVPQKTLGSLAEKNVRLLYAVLLAVEEAAARAWLAGKPIP